VSNFHRLSFARFTDALNIRRAPRIRRRDISPMAFEKKQLADKERLTAKLLI
jgi:hypothetical protein